MDEFTINKGEIKRLRNEMGLELYIGYTGMLSADVFALTVYVKRITPSGAVLLPLLVFSNYFQSDNVRLDGFSFRVSGLSSDLINLKSLDKKPFAEVLS